LFIVLQQIGTPFLGAFQGLLATPVGDFFVVANVKEPRALSSREKSQAWYIADSPKDTQRYHFRDSSPVVV
jgi:hypothetical protein